MFDDLATQIKHDINEQVNTRERVIRYAIIGVLAILLFFGLYLAVRAGV